MKTKTKTKTIKPRTRKPRRKLTTIPVEFTDTLLAAYTPPIIKPEEPFYSIARKRQNAGRSTRKSLPVYNGACPGSY